MAIAETADTLEQLTFLPDPKIFGEKRLDVVELRESLAELKVGIGGRYSYQRANRVLRTRGELASE